MSVDSWGLVAIVMVLRLEVDAELYVVLETCQAGEVDNSKRETLVLVGKAKGSRNVWNTFLGRLQP